MRRIDTSLPGVYLIEPRVLTDSRGFFFESYHARRYAELGVTARFVQDNHSCSARGTVRGLHYQLAHPQAKLCRVIRGEVFDVVVDIRRGSPHFGQWAGNLLSAETRQQIFIPRGFAHGFQVLTETAEFLYQCDDYYYADDQYGIAWDDPQLAIPWHTEAPLIHSEKDLRHPSLAAAPPGHLPHYTSAAVPELVSGLDLTTLGFTLIAGSLSSRR